jgi:di/tripeptidase
MTVYERFLKYVSYPTTSDENNPCCPSTEGQRVLDGYKGKS